MTAFGRGLTLGSYAVQTPVTNAAQVGLILLLSLPLTLLADAILHANNIRDAANDSALGYLTVASLLGPAASQVLQTILIFDPVVLVVLCVVMRLLPLSALAIVLAIPMLLKAFRTGDVPITAQTHLRFGILYAGGMAAMARSV